MKTQQLNEASRFNTKPLTASLRYMMFGLAINTAFPQLVLAEQTNSSNTVVFFSIERGELEKAHEQFASQTGLNLSYEENLMSGKTTAGIQGEYLTPEALNQLIKGTGLSSVSTSTGFKIESRSEQTSSMQMPSITITAEAIENSYQPLVRLNTATRSSASVFETPQAIDVVSATSILDRGADSLTSALDYTPGVTTSTGEGTREQFIIRGFSAISDTYVDGMRDAGHPRAVSLRTPLRRRRQPRRGRAGTLIFRHRIRRGVVRVRPVRCAGRDRAPPTRACWSGATPILRR